MIPWWQSDDGRAILFNGDSLDVLKGLPDKSIDACVTDPPYGMSEVESKHVVAALTAWLKGEEYVHNKKGFMGRTWDSFVPGPELWREVFRVLKPGGHLLAFSSTRTQHLMNIAIHLAGFEVRDTIQWHYGSGFPKSLNVSKAIDRAAGVKQKVVGSRVLSGNAAQSTKEKGGTYASNTSAHGLKKEVPITEATTEAAKKWEGWGTALKPATEPIVVARKPVSGRVAANVMQYGTGALNISECRVAHTNETDRAKTIVPQPNTRTKRPGVTDFAECSRNGEMFDPGSGRWPPNLLLTHSADCKEDKCAHDCPVALMDRQSGTLTSGALKPYKEHHDNATSFRFEREKTYESAANSGGASRFFPVSHWTEEDQRLAVMYYTAKAARAEREIGLAHRSRRKVGDGRKKDIDNAYQRGRTERVNVHPTVKPIEVMRWLVRLVTPPNGVVLEPFLGSGTTAIAAIREGFQVIGIEREEEYATIARDRFIGDAPLLNRGSGEKTKIDEEIEKVTEERKRATQQTLFGS